MIWNNSVCVVCVCVGGGGEQSRKEVQMSLDVCSMWRLVCEFQYMSGWWEITGERK